MPIDRGEERVWEAMGELEERMISMGEGWNEKVEELRRGMKELRKETISDLRTVIDHVKETDKTTEENRRRIDRTLEVAQKTK